MDHTGHPVKTFPKIQPLATTDLELIERVRKLWLNAISIRLPGVNLIQIPGGCSLMRFGRS